MTVQSINTNSDLVPQCSRPDTGTRIAAFCSVPGPLYAPPHLESILARFVVWEGMEQKDGKGCQILSRLRMCEGTVVRCCNFSDKRRLRFVTCSSRA